MTVITTRHRTVMRYELDAPTSTVFATVTDDEGDHSELLHLDPAMHAEMGHPRHVTVTVEPGDLLNELPEHYEPMLAQATVEQLLNELHDRLADVGTDTQEVDQLLAELPTEVLSLRTEGSL